MEAIVVTGGTRGIGYALADRLAAMGCAVAVCGRTREAADAAAARLADRHGDGLVAGFGADVRDPRQVEALWDAVRDRFGPIGIWINNAGLSNRVGPVWQASAEDLAAVVESNILGTLYGSRVAIRRMLEQGRGAVYNMEGLGSDGHVRKGLVPYGTTKCAIRYLTRGLAEEVEGTPVIVGSLRPGMVITEMVTDQYRGDPEGWARARRIFNVIADLPGPVAAHLAPMILANRRNGARLQHTTPLRMMLRFAWAPLVRRDLFGEESR